MSRTRMLASAISAGLTVAGLTIVGVGSPAGAAARPTTAPSAPVQATAVPATAAMTTVAGSVAPFASRTTVIGAVAAGQRLSIQLWLRPRTAAATRFAQLVSTPGSAQFQHYLSPDGYAARFGATPADGRAVESWLRAGGFTAISTDSQRSYVRATATAATINRAFGVRLLRYRSSAAVNGGTQALWSNDRPISLPRTLARIVLAVTGLDSAVPVAAASTETGSSIAASSVQCSAYYGQHLQGGLPARFGRTSFPTQVCGYSAKQLRAAYGASMTSTGQGQTIALTEEGPLAANDFLALQDYAKHSGLPAPSRQRFAERSAGKGCTARFARPQQPGSGPALQLEEQMDMEAAYAMAPGAKILMVGGLTCGGSDPEAQALINAAQAVVNGSGQQPFASIVSNSWKSDPEGGQPASVTKLEHSILLKAAAEGVGMYFASGDSSGVVAPADDPYAIAVGGTTLGIGKTMNRLFETGWSTGLLVLKKGAWVSEGEAGASGGGPSVVWKQPSYQQGIVPAALARAAGHSGLSRSVPDISADGDSDTPMTVGLFKPGTMVFELTPGAGTSLATPLVAGLVADAQQGSKTPFGFLNPVLYQLAGTSALHDMLPLTAASPSLYRAESCEIAVCGEQALSAFNVRSDNKAASYTGQVTLKGYDNMTGLGTPNGQAFITALRNLER